MQIDYKLVILLIGLGLTQVGCVFRSSTRGYDCARAAYENVLYRYDRELEILAKMDRQPDNEHRLRLNRELKEEILLKNEEFSDEFWGWRKHAAVERKNYPYMQYKDKLDHDITLLEAAKAKLYWKQDGLGKSVQGLIEQMDQLRRYVVLHVEYERERKLMEQRKNLQLAAQKDSKKGAGKKAAKA